MQGFDDVSAPCNSCGTKDLAAEVRLCSHCPTLICLRCRTNHEAVCEDNQRKKRKGLGTTVHTLQDNQTVGLPAQNQVDFAKITTDADVDQGLAGVAELLKG